MSRLIEWYFKADWDRDGIFDDESANLISASGQMRLMAPGEALTGGRGVIDEAQVVLRNTDQRYNPDYAAGPLYTYLQDGGGYQIPAFLSVSVTNTGMSETAIYHRLITGTITIPKDQPASVNTGSIAQFTVRSRDELIREHKLSTALRQNYTESENIVYALTQAGFVDGTDFFTPAVAASQTPPVTPTIDAGLHTIPAFYLDDEAVLPELWDLASSCGGWFYCDPDGMFNYASATRWLNEDTPAYFLDPGKWGGYSKGYNDGNLVKTVVVELSPMNELTEAVLWESDEIVTVAAGATKTITAKLRQPATSVYGMVSAVDWRAVTSGGTDITGNVTISLTKYAQRVEMTIANNHGWRTAFLVRLQLRGIGLDGRPGQQVEVTSTDGFWTDRTPRKLTTSGFYIQTYAQAKFLADFHIDRHEQPTMFHSITGLPGRPAMRLGHQVAISLEAGVITPNTRYAHVYEIRWRLSRQGFSQDVELVDRERLYAYATASPVKPYFRLGATALGTAGRYFY